MSNKATKSINEFKTPSLFLMLGSPEAGKTNVICHLLYEMCKANKFDYGLVFTDSPQYYNKWLPEEYIHQLVDEKILKRLLKKQKDYFIANGEHPKAFLVFDDCMGYNFSTPFFKGLISAFRNYGLTIFFGVQWLTGLRQPLIYKCATYAFIFYQDDLKSIKVIHEHYGAGLWKKIEDLTSQIQTHCRDHNVLIY